MIASNIWEEILYRVQAKVNRHSFYTWFKPTAFVADDGSMVTVRVPNALFKDWITKHYSGVIAEASHDKEEVLIGEVDFRVVEDVRRNWPFLRDRRIDSYGAITNRLSD